MKKLKILVFSDAHGRGERINQVVRESKDVRYILYAGDTIKDLDDLKLSHGMELIMVKGNCDYGVDAPVEELVDINLNKILLTHGNKYNIKLGIDRLYYRAKELSANIVIFGHTHFRFASKEDDILFFNPGSISLPRDGRPPSYGLIEIFEDKIDYQHIDFY